MSTVALAATGAVAGPVAAQVSGPENCPVVMPTDDIETGMTGTGFTVSKGSDPEPFDVDVLGVLENGVAPGRDMIVVETSSTAIDKAGGIWFGMSGSPVYDDSGRLMGAVAFSLSGGPSHIGGLTPAEDMADLLNYPSGLAPKAARTVALSGGLERRVAERESGARTDFTLRRLRAPLSVSGLTERGLDVLAKAIRKEGGKYVVTQGSSARAAEPGSELATVGAGDTFAAAMSYGDITMAGIGTTALVCDGRAVAFGHPFSWTGRTELGANRGLTHAIVDDPLFGPYKLANITEPVGTVDQDRLAGIRGLLGATPHLRTINSSVSAPDIGRAEEGSSQGVTDDIVPILGFFHLYSNIDSTFDSIGEGSSQVEWMVTGLTESGEPWTLSRSNLYSSGFDISIESSFEVLNQLSRLLNNRFTEIDFDSVELNATVEEGRSGYRIGKVLHKTKEGDFRGGRQIRVRPGSILTLRVDLASIGGGPHKEVKLKVNVPRNFRLGFLEVQGGSSSGSFACFEELGPCSSRAGNVDSFDELIDSLEKAPKGNDLSATLSVRGSNKQRSDTASLDGVVAGSRFLRLRSTRR
ncbi:MAG: SpoIVB peptidase S55 domain-containing protein [Actinomycetota bacterium]